MALVTGGDTPPGESWRKLVELCHGLAGVGKSAHMLSFPEPFWVFNLDRPLGPLIKLLPPTHRVDYEALTVDTIDTSPSQAQAYLNKFDRMLARALRGQIETEPNKFIDVPKDGTLFVDGWDIFWDLVKIAKVKNLAEDLPKEYAQANTYMHGVLGRLGRSQLNVGFTTISSKVWKGAKTETDHMKADGFKHKDRMLTHEVYLFSPEDTRTPLENPDQAAVLGQSHRGYITMSKLNERLIGTVLPNITYSTLYALTFGEKYPQPERLWSPVPVAKAAAVAGGASA